LTGLPDRSKLSAMRRFTMAVILLAVLALGALAAGWPLYSLYSSGGVYYGWDESSWKDFEFLTPHQHYLRAARCQSNKTIISLTVSMGYALTICGDGSVVYEGFYEGYGGPGVVKGVRQTKIRSAEVQELVGAFQDIDYFTLDDYDACRRADDGATYTSLTLGTRRKSVVHGVIAPLKLKKLEKKIAGVAQRSGYIDAAVVNQEYESGRQTEEFLLDQIRASKQFAKHHPHDLSNLAKLEEKVERCFPPEDAAAGADYDNKSTD
jgi:hypothetical protein